MSYKKFGYTYEYFHKMCPHNADRNMCPSCGEFFNSTAAFDKHRIDAPEGRRCMDATEMLAKGMSKKETGHWVTRKMDSTAVARAVGKTSQESKGVARGE